MKDMRNELLLADNVKKAAGDLVIQKLPLLLLQTKVMDYDLEDCVIVANLSSAPHTADVMLTADFMEKYGKRVSEPMELINHYREKGIMPGAYISSVIFAAVGLGSLEELSRMREKVKVSRYEGNFDECSRKAKELDQMCNDIGKPVSVASVLVNPSTGSVVVNSKTSV